VEDVRTSWVEHDPELQQVLENIRTVNAKLKRACCRYQSLVLYLPVLGGQSLVIPVSLVPEIREEGRVLKGS